MRIVDEHMNDVPPGEVGEIVYRGPGTMAGYWQNPRGRASEAFRGGWFHSGDLVREDEEGFLYVVDRKKDMIITGGENVYCAEVENALAAHPAVAEVSVDRRAEHEKWGETPVAVAVLHAGATLDLAELREWARRAAWPATSCRPSCTSSTSCRATPAARSPRSRCASAFA